MNNKAAKTYSKPKLTKYAHLKSVTFSQHALDQYDYEGDDGGSEG